MFAFCSVNDGVRKFGNKHVVKSQADNSGRGEVGILILRFILSLLLCSSLNDAVNNNNNNNNNFLWSNSPPVGQGFLIIQAWPSHLETPHPVGLLWTSDHVDLPQADNTQHLQETDIHIPAGIRKRNPRKRAPAYPRLRRCGHWDRPNYNNNVNFLPLVNPRLSRW